MAWTTPKTWSTSELVTAANMNLHVRDNLAYLKDRIDPVLVNRSGGTLAAGAVVIFDGSNNSSFTTTIVENDRRVIGVLAASTADDAEGTIDSWGVRNIQVVGTVARGEALITSTTAGKAKGAGSYTWSTGVIGYALEGGTDTTLETLLIIRPHTSQQPAAAYVCGGYTTGYVADCEEYDPDVWTSKTDLVSPARSQHTFRGAGPLFAVGGMDGSALSDNDEYDPDTWTSRTAALGTAAQLYGGHAGYYNGVVAFHRTNTVYLDEYNVSGDSWSNTTGAARAVYNRGSGVADNYLYEFGSSGGVAYTDQYDFAGTYTNVNDMPVGKSKTHGCGIDNETCLAGGGYVSAWVDTMYAFDPNTWATKTASGAVRGEHAMFDIGSLVYLCFGTSGTLLTSNQEYDFSADGYTAKTAGPAPARSALAGESI